MANTPIISITPSHGVLALNNVDQALDKNVEDLCEQLKGKKAYSSIERITAIRKRFTGFTIYEAQQQLDTGMFLAEVKEGLERQQHMGYWRLARTVVSFFPLMLTWVGLSLAAGAYQQYLNNHHTSNTSFFLLWQQGFDGVQAFGRFSAPTFAEVALLDFMFLLLLVLLYIFVHIKEDNIEAKSEELRKDIEKNIDDMLALLAEKGTTRMLSQRDIDQLSDTINKGIDKATLDRLELFAQMSQSFQDMVTRMDQSLASISKQTDLSLKDLVKATVVQIDNLLQNADARQVKFINATSQALEVLINESNARFQQTSSEADKILQAFNASLHQFTGPMTDLAVDVSAFQKKMENYVAHFQKLTEAEQKLASAAGSLTGHADRIAEGVANNLNAYQQITKALNTFNDTETQLTATMKQALSKSEEVLAETRMLVHQLIGTNQQVLHDLLENLSRAASQVTNISNNLVDIEQHFQHMRDKNKTGSLSSPPVFLADSQQIGGGSASSQTRAVPGNSPNQLGVTPNLEKNTQPGTSDYEAKKSDLPFDPRKSQKKPR